MGKLTKNTITRGMVAALALSAGATTANAAVTRVSGADRYATAAQVLNAWPTVPTSAVLAAGVGHDVDALTVAPLAKQKNAPIILVDTTATTAAIVAQFANFTTVYIANGSGVISENVATALTAAGKTVVRLGGANRYETALNIAKAFGTANNIVIANGDDAHLVDSLSIASIAAAKGMPIFLSTSTSLDSAEAMYAKGLGATDVYVLGGTTLVSDASVAGLGTEVRLAGAGRYETNAKIVTNFKSDAALDLSNVYIASGEDANLIDSLVAAPLAGLKKAPIVFAHSSLNADVNTLLTGVIDAKTNITVIGGNGAVSDAAFSAIQNIQTPGSGNTGNLSVSSVSAISATSIKVVFNQAPADKTKVTFGVTRSGSPLTMTAAWNASNTEATLTYSANLPEDTYTVDVMNGTTDLGKSTVAVTKQKVAKINIIGDTIAVSAPVGAVPGKGYISYQVLDQYGMDITNASLASSSNINWNSSIGDVDATKGLLTITTFSSTVPLTTYTSTIITAIDSDSNISTSNTFKVALSQGTLSDLKLNTLSNAEGKVLTDGDTLNKFYLDYTALDVSGNATKIKTLVDAGLLNSDSTVNAPTTLYSSNPNLVKATVVEDPTDSNKAVIEVDVVNLASTPIYADTPIIITAMTKTGKSSSINLVLKKASTLDSISIIAPSQDVAVGDTNIEIPYTAVDQNGVALTKFSDIVDNISSITPGLSESKNADGTLKLSIDTIVDGTTVYQVVTKTGKSSMITIKAQKTAAPDSLTIDATKVKQYMQLNAVQKMDFGIDAGGLSIQDQYGRTIDLTNGNSIKDALGVAHTYTVQATTGSAIDNYTTVGVINPDGTAATGTNPWEEAYNGNQLAIHAAALGTQTVTFTVYKDGVATDISKNLTFTVVKDSDIKSFASDTVKTLYATATVGASTNGYSQSNPGVHGLLSNGGAVALADLSIKSKTIDNNVFTFIDDDSTKDIVASSVNMPSGTTEATGTLTTTVLVDGSVSSVTTPLKASTVAPAVASIDASITTAVKDQGGLAGTVLGGIATGVTVSGDTVTLTPAAMAALSGKSLFEYVNGVATTTGNVYFHTTDQYGNEVTSLSYGVLTQPTTANTGVYAMATDGTGVFSATGTITSNDSFTVSVSAGSFVKTLKFIVK